jgi:excisionase family DNA binding protein
MPRAPKPVEPPVSKMIGLPEAAEQLGVDVYTIRRLIAAGKLPAYRIGSKIIRLHRDDVERLLIPIKPSGKG